MAGRSSSWGAASGWRADARTAYVAPHLVPADNPLAEVNDVFNAVVVRGNATGEVMFCGRGAGELPTASACVADVIECLQEDHFRPEISWSAEEGGFVLPAGAEEPLVSARGGGRC